MEKTACQWSRLKGVYQEVSFNHLKFDMSLRQQVRDVELTIGYMSPEFKKKSQTGDINLRFVGI